MRRLLTFLAAVGIFAVIHEGAHILVSLALDEYQTFVVHPYGFEVIVKTPVEEREGIQWAFFSGTSNLVTVLLGYLFFALRAQIARLQGVVLRAVGYWLTLLLMLADPLNLSVGPLIYGGDIRGIVTGLGVHPYLIQGLAFAVFLLNRELIARRLPPAYGIQTDHPFFKPWFRLPQHDLTT